MGDEFDPSTPEWAVLVSRWRTILDFVTPVTGVGPFTNHLASSAVLSQALIDMPEQWAHLSFDTYDEPAALALAAEFDGQVNHLMCAVNALKHGPFSPTATRITRHMKNLRVAGADSFLIFGGATPYNGDLTPDPAFGNTSLVNRIGGPDGVGERCAARRPALTTLPARECFHRVRCAWGVARITLGVDLASQQAYGVGVARFCAHARSGPWSAIDFDGGPWTCQPHRLVRQHPLSGVMNPPN